MKKIMSLMFAATICFSLVACSSGSDTSDTKKEETKTEEKSTETKTKTKKKEVAKVGETVGDDMAVITVNSVNGSKEDNNSYNTADKLENGQEYLTIDASVENVSDEPINLSILSNYKVKDGDGRECDLASTAKTNGNLNATGLEPGEKVTGEIVFITPDEGDLFLYFYPEIFGEANYKIQIR